MGELAGQLGEKRRKAARTLGKRIDEGLGDLGLPGARLPIAVEEREAMMASHEFTTVTPPRSPSWRTMWSASSKLPRTGTTLAP